MRFSIQSIKKLVATASWKIAGTTGLSVSLVARGRSYSLSRCTAVRDSLLCCGQKLSFRLGQGNLRDNDASSIPLLSRSKLTTHWRKMFFVVIFILS